MEMATSESETLTFYDVRRSHFLDRGFDVVVYFDCDMQRKTFPSLDTLARAGIFKDQSYRF